MQNKSAKIIIDTNLWISFLISKNFNQLDEILFSKDVTLIFSEELMSEFLGVAKRPKFRKFFPQEDIENIQEYADFVEVKSEVSICRDVKDNFLLALSKDSNANFLITGDKDLLELETFEKTKIVTINSFFEI